MHVACMYLSLSEYLGPTSRWVQPRICTNRDDLDLQIGLSDWPVEMRNSPWVRIQQTSIRPDLEAVSYL